MYFSKGKEFVGELRGTLSLAIFDINKAVLICYMDQIGDRGAFYYSRKGIIIGSEVKFLTDYCLKYDISLTLNNNAIFDILTFGYWSLMILVPMRLREFLQGDI